MQYAIMSRANKFLPERATSISSLAVAAPTSGAVIGVLLLILLVTVLLIVFVRYIVLFTNNFDKNNVWCVEYSVSSYIYWHTLAVLSETFCVVKHK